MPKSPDAFAGAGEDTVVIHAEKGAANLSPEAIQRQKEIRNELLKARGAEIAQDAGKFVKETSQAAKSALKSGMGNALATIGTALSKGWSGLGKAAGFAWDSALLGLGAGAYAKDKTVEAAGKAKVATVEAAGKAKDKTIEVAGQVKAGVVETAVATRDFAVDTKNAVKSQLLDDVSNRSEVLQAGRAAGEYLSEKSDQAKEYVAGKVTAAGEAYDAAKESLLRNGRAIIESKAAKYTAKGLKYAGIGTAATIGVPLAAGAYTDAATLEAAVPGCIFNSATSPFAYCDEVNGWIMPTYTASSTFDSTWQAEWGGVCIPVCFKAGDQTSDDCWHATSNVAATNVAAQMAAIGTNYDADDELS
jgi:hypothetical protein